MTVGADVEGAVRLVPSRQLLWNHMKSGLGADVGLNLLNAGARLKAADEEA